MASADVDGRDLQEPRVRLRVPAEALPRSFPQRTDGCVLDFVDPGIADTVNVSTYVSELFPKLGPAQIAEATREYAPVGTPFQQAVASMGESIPICPTYVMCERIQGKCSAAASELAVPLGAPGSDLPYYWPSDAPQPRPLIQPMAPVSMPGGPPFAGPAFDNAFAQSFLAVARFGAPGVHVLPHDITPAWAPWAQGHTEMLFNRTSAGAPVVHTVTTDNALLARFAFWESVTALTGQ